MESQGPIRPQQPDGLGIFQSEKTPDRAIEPPDQSNASTLKTNQATLRRRRTIIEPASHSIASTSKVRQTTTLERRPTRTASSSSLISKLTSAPVVISPQTITRPLTVHQASERPFAFNFFNPATDLQTEEPPIPPSSRSLGVPPEQGPTNLARVTRPLLKPDSLPRRDSFPSFPDLSSLAPSPLFRTHFGEMSVREPSPFVRAAREHGLPAGTYTDIE